MIDILGQTQTVAFPSAYPILSNTYMDVPVIQDRQTFSPYKINSMETPEGIIKVIDFNFLINCDI